MTEPALAPVHAGPDSSSSLGFRGSPRRTKGPRAGQSWTLVPLSVAFALFPVILVPVSASAEPFSGDTRTNDWYIGPSGLDARARVRPGGAFSTDTGAGGLHVCPRGSPVGASDHRICGCVRLLAGVTAVLEGATAQVALLAAAFGPSSARWLESTAHLIRRLGIGESIPQGGSLRCSIVSPEFSRRVPPYMLTAPSFHFFGSNARKRANHWWKQQFFIPLL